MKLNLHPKEFLALYNLLSIQRSAAADDPALQLVYSRMKACIVSALTKCGEVDSDAAFSGWEKNQKKKIDALKEQLKTVSSKDFMSLDNED